MAALAGWRSPSLALLVLPCLAPLEAVAEAIVSPPYWSLDAGNDKACRGLFEFDNSPRHYYVPESKPSLEACQEHCRLDPNCTGIEYSLVYGQRCEIWVRPYGVGAVVSKRDFACLRYQTGMRSPLDFARRGPWVNCDREPCYEWSLVDGGQNRACRGGNETDDEESYYILHEGTKTLDDCVNHCNNMNVACSTGYCHQACSGVEFHPAFNEGRCEVWTRPGHMDWVAMTYQAGIGTTAPKEGFTCMRFQAIGMISQSR